MLNNQSGDIGHSTFSPTMFINGRDVTPKQAEYHFNLVNEFSDGRNFDTMDS